MTARAGVLLAALLLAGCGRPVADARFDLAGAEVQGGLLTGVAPRGAREMRLDGAPLRLAADGRFLVGFGRDDRGPFVLEAVMDDGRVLRRALVPAPRAWRIDRLPARMARRYPPNPEFDARRARETAAVAAARAGLPGEGWRERFAWPAAGRITGMFGDQRFNGAVPRSPHFGVDVAAPAGTPFTAPASGTVTLAAGPLLFEGKMVMLDHGNGLVSDFMHLSRIDVAVGQRVRQGQVLGAIGSTGRSTGPHLHWGLTLNQPGAKNGHAKLDPALLTPAIADGRTP